MVRSILARSRAWPGAPVRARQMLARSTVRMGSGVLRFLGDRWLVRCLDQPGRLQALLQETLQPLHLSYLGAREEVDGLGVQILTVPPPVAPRHPAFLG